MTTYTIPPHLQAEFDEGDRQRKLRFERWLKKWPLRVPGRFDMARDEIVEMHDWLDEQCVGKWSVKAQRVETEHRQRPEDVRRRPMVGFTNENDAFNFKIRWA